MSNFSKSLLHILRTIEGAPFEKRGELYEESLVLLKQVESDYRSWRQQHFALFISRFSAIDSIQLVLDVDEEEGLNEFWGITFRAKDWEAYLPVHWLVDSFSQHDQGSFGSARKHFVHALKTKGIVVDSLFWEQLQALSSLVWEDTKFWSGVHEIYNRTEYLNTKRNTSFL